MASFTQGPTSEAEMLWKKRKGDITAEYREHADDPSFKVTNSEPCLTIARNNSCAQCGGRTNRTLGEAPGTRKWRRGDRDLLQFLFRNIKDILPTN